MPVRLFRSASRPARLLRPMRRPGMRMLAWAGVFLVAVEAQAAPFAPHWVWEGKGATGGDVELNLVRASVRVLRRPGPVRIEITARGQPDLSGARLVVADTKGGISVTDIYPPHPALLPSGIECEPPIGARGDFLHNDLVLDATLHLPPGVDVSGHIMGRREPPQIGSDAPSSRSGGPPGKKAR